MNNAAVQPAKKCLRFGRAGLRTLCGCSDVLSGHGFTACGKIARNQNGPSNLVCELRRLVRAQFQPCRKRLKIRTALAAAVALLGWEPSASAGGAGLQSGGTAHARAIGFSRGGSVLFVARGCDLSGRSSASKAPCSAPMGAPCAAVARGAFERSFSGALSGHDFRDCGKSQKRRHSEERSDEESLFSPSLAPKAGHQ